MTNKNESSTNQRSDKKIREIEEEIERLMQEEQEERNAQFQEEEEPSKPPVKQETQEPKEDENLSAEEKNWKTRYGDLRRHQQKQEKDFQDQINKLKEQLEKGPTRMPTSEEEVAAWVQKYPDVAAIIETLADKKARERGEDIDRRLKDLEEIRENIEREKAEQELMKFHPDFDEIRDTDTFHEWAAGQPKWVQTALYEDTDIKAAARAIDLYKMDMGIKTKTPDRNAAMAVNTRTRVTPQDDAKDSWFSESQVQKMSEKEFESKSEEIEKAMREGRFKYDLSQKSR